MEIVNNHGDFEKPRAKISTALATMMHARQNKRWKRSTQHLQQL